MLCDCDWKENDGENLDYGRTRNERGERRAIGDGSDESESTGGSSLDYQNSMDHNALLVVKSQKVIGIAN